MSMALNGRHELLRCAQFPTHEAFELILASLKLSPKHVSALSAILVSMCSQSAVANWDHIGAARASPFRKCHPEEGEGPNNRTCGCGDVAVHRFCDQRSWGGGEGRCGAFVCVGGSDAT